MTFFEEYIQASRGLVFVATVKDNQPSIGIMGFAVSPERENLWYFNVDPTSYKVNDVDNNDRVAIITPFNENGARIESNDATMTRSNKTWADVKPLFIGNKSYMQAHPNIENEIVLELYIHSASLTSYGYKKDVNFE
ncbi:pyridoxamine 5'-phosphate oxidase family protein [Leuconostoc koreense]|nr:pyridoxamine 5'-phosphate oxidase family protein [Leuconostoc mesenteroides]QGM25087.1 pyridoxamine 5'-phosphate oxidase family protein [Leuconostoc mesenteroides subsp. mesenteroides]